MRRKHLGVILNSLLGGNLSADCGCRLFIRKCKIQETKPHGPLLSLSHCHKQTVAPYVRAAEGSGISV